MIDEQYRIDLDTILSHRHDNGADYWMTTDENLTKGSPFSTIGSALLLAELGLGAEDSIMQEIASIIFSKLKEDGRFKLSPKGAVYPCHTVNGLSTICHMGFGDDARLDKTFAYLLETQEADGGWRCKKFSYGRGPETEASNPLPTLNALDAFRLTQKNEPALDRAVEFLLQHWVTREPLGPCHYGIGSLFMQVEYPFRSYNLFSYVYVLSFYDYARQDTRFRQAFDALKSKTVNGEIIVERVVPKLAKLDFCRKGQPSKLGTRRYQEILGNLGE